jgi:hypothetical protein
MESTNHDNEESFAFLKRKHQDTISEISVHMEALSKAKLKYFNLIQIESFIYHYSLSLLYIFK